ncbi:ATP-binding cassette domain-containing protein [Crossiella sp. CA-258035]|uniref:ATP-binding cassette domain-containing protein n=1 Tax=Crossiella sp. CA-258035 TaxID=2981138 RepID=UPI0024BD1667|nr:ATP-binding cassette domain-containing protein [Crossiella sp. CA-258035]WHT21267.1 ATP-binding cassette domain-containing protein [Crossiella sp. CA-258035]
MDSDAVISVSGLRKSFGSTPVLRGVDLTVRRGRMLALLGPNGAGKTTVVRILSTLLAADGGTALVNGAEVGRRPDRVRRMIGLTGQQTALDGLLTGRENLVMLGRLHRLSRRAAKARATELLAEFELAGAADRAVSGYSGGMRRRLDLAASLITAPPVLFLDEPTTGLDPRSRNTLWTAIERLLAEGTTILLTTQYLEEADRLADQVVLLDHGRVIAEGSPAELKATVGAERLELTFAGTAELDRALAALPAEALRHEGEAPRLSLAVDGARQLRQVLEQLETAGLEPTGLALTRPTLDDVFLSLTGARPAAETVGGAA